jgi:hypothetical protein
MKRTAGDERHTALPLAVSLCGITGVATFCTPRLGNETFRQVGEVPLLAP